MGMGLGRLAFLLSLPLALGATAGTSMAWAGDCPGNPDALGVSRTIVVDPREHGRIGTMSYAETLPLADKEVVLTFDDGPIPPYTGKILDILAAECVKATYFIVGTMAREYPALLRRVYDEGHTVGTHSMSHPIPFIRQGVERTRQQIDDGIKATEAALGDPTHVAPFFRFPGFGRTDPAEGYLAERGLMAWGADVPADDWRPIGPSEVAKRGMRRLDAMGKGIVLLHDIHQRTVDALPMILKELKAGGYRIVHVVPATADRPATITTADEWRMRSRSKPPLPMLALADVQDLNGLLLTDKSATELCALQAPQRERRHARRPIEKPAAERPREAKLRDDKAVEIKASPIKVAGINLLGIKLLGVMSRDTHARTGKPREANDDKRMAQASGERPANHARAKHASADKKEKKVAGAKVMTPDLHAIR
jgi:peptidoglycan/xylan/chitin deacetylase (PgdA/CDA1 family)